MVPFTPAALRTPDFLGLVGKGASNRALSQLLACDAAPRLRLVGMKTWGPLHQVLPDITRSDHFPFWLDGVPAVLWTDTGNFRNPHYHLVTDTPDTLDFEFMDQVRQVLLAALTNP